MVQILPEIPRQQTFGERFSHVMGNLGRAASQEIPGLLNG